MLDEDLEPMKNDSRFQVIVNNFKRSSYIEYQVLIFDLCFGKLNKLILRFSEIKKFHQTLIATLNKKKLLLPEFPKTNSFGLWNKTIDDPKKIQERRRELEYYFTRLCNNTYLRGLKFMDRLLKYSVNDHRKVKSVEKCKKTQNQKRRTKSLTAHDGRTMGNIFENLKLIY